MTIAATTTTNAEAVAARNPRRTCGCAPDGFGLRASSVGVVGLFLSSGVIGWVRERRRSRAAERTRRLGEEAGQAVTIVWRPSPEVVERANVTRLMRAHGVATEEELIERSTSDVEWFWDAAIRDLGLELYEPYTSILDTSRGVEWATWFGGGSVNLAHNCVDRWAERTPDATAIA